MRAQDERPVPILTGSTSYFTRVTGGQYQDTLGVSPLLLAPLGDKWLFEGKGFYADTYKKDVHGDYTGTASYGLAYGQIDYIANPFVTVTGGRFITPFGVYGERLAPNWIRALQVTPTIGGVPRGTSTGGMLRGGLPVRTDKFDLNYAFYFSTSVTNHMMSSDRTTGGRVGFFLSGPRLEMGGSFQKVLLNTDRSHALGTHFIWQPNRIPLTIRSEYAWSNVKGSGYWIESAYRLSQIPHGRPIEIVGRAQQYMGLNLKAKVAAKFGVPAQDTQQADLGMNYYFGRDVRASASYGRQFSVAKDTNIWSVGLTYRFIMPMWPKGNL